ncbi:sensor histidine kinase [Dyella acidiphila]|uniref:histidine kinase n=1 Tax=Dyella acidiphila TaxID=2775866 RepID=A0ABR9GBN5_9GAMM|nr:ATP-binding protein [Dyella acidiphila]MBE1161447.1 PAS domain S-box protein [Dyella acidiphila]
MIRGTVRQVAALRWRTGGLLLAVLVIVALPYMIMRGGSRQALDAGELVTRAAEVQALVYRIADQTYDSEAAIQHLLADDPYARGEETVQNAERLVPNLLDQLHRLVADNAEQEHLVEQLSAVENGRLALLHQALQRYKHNDAIGAGQALRDAGNLFRIDDIASRLVGSAELQLQHRREAAQQLSRDSSTALALTAIAQLVMLTIVVVVSERQIGKRLRAEIGERQAVQRSQMILQAVREPIALLDNSLRTLLVNAAFSELYGVSEDSRAEYLDDIGQGAWADEVLQQRLRDVLLRDRELWDYELTQRTIDGVERHVVINARRLQQQDSENPVLLLTVSDVTARALVEQQVKELNHQLEGKVVQISDVNRELEAFSYSVSHDLRAPLRHITAFAQKLELHLGDDVDVTTHHYLGVIRDASQRMAQLIDDLLVFSRLGRGALRLQAVDMQSLVDEARMLAESEVPDRHIEWQVDPMPVVVGDENMLRTVWQNLIGNAVKYTGQTRTAYIRVSVEHGESGDFEFTVSDNGAGFDMRYVDKLFGVFQRLHKASEFPGNGIGLANVQRIVSRHGGRVWAEGEPGQGAQFHFTLSAVEPPVANEWVSP